MSSWPLVSNGEVRPSPRLPVLDLDDLCGSFGCPEWRDGEFPHLAKHVLIVRESGFICSASMRDPANWKEMLKDYLSLRHFEPEERALPCFVEVYSGGRLLAQSRVIVTHSEKRTTPRFHFRESAWNKIVREMTCKKPSARADQACSMSRCLSQPANYGS